MGMVNLSQEIIKQLNFFFRKAINVRIEFPDIK